jgi:hypothetical protein
MRAQNIRNIHSCLVYGLLVARLLRHLDSDEIDFILKARLGPEVDARRLNAVFAESAKLMVRRRSLTRAVAYPIQAHMPWCQRVAAYVVLGCVRRLDFPRKLD